MLRIITAAAVLLLLTGSAAAGGTVEATSFFSTSMNQEKNVWVYLPEGYYEQGWSRYPVIYYYHGAGQMLGHNDFEDVCTALDQVIEAGEIKPVILVMPWGFSSPYPAGFYTSSVLYGDQEGYMTEDLVAWMDSNYRTIPSHRKRAVMGHSMGGYGAILYYSKHPDLFCGAAAVCGSGLDLPTMLAINIYGVLAELTGPPYCYDPSAGFANAVLFSMAGAFTPNLSNPPYYVDLPIDEWADYVPEVWAVWLEHNLPEYMGWMGSDGNEPVLYFDAGTLDQFYILPACNAFAENLDALGIDYEYQVFVGGHFDQLHVRFPIALNFLCDVMNHTWRWGSDSSAGYGMSGTMLIPEYFSSGQTITFRLTTPADVAVTVYDATGRMVASPVNGSLEPGTHSFSMAGEGLSTGMYFYAITAGNHTVTGKLLVAD